MKRLLLACICLAVTWSAAAQTARMDLEAFGRIVRLSDPQIAPDGEADRRRRVARELRREPVRRRPHARRRRVRLAAHADERPPRRRTAALVADRRPARLPGAGTGVAGARSEAAGLRDGDVGRRRSPRHRQRRPACSTSPGRRTARGSPLPPRTNRRRATGIERHNRSFEIGNDDFLIQAAPQPTHIWLVTADGGDGAGGSRRAPGACRPASRRVRPRRRCRGRPTGDRSRSPASTSPHSGDFDGRASTSLDVAAGTRARR